MQPSLLREEFTYIIKMDFAPTMQLCRMSLLPLNNRLTPEYFCLTKVELSETNELRHSLFLICNHTHQIHITARQTRTRALGKGRDCG